LARLHTGGYLETGRNIQIPEDDLFEFRPAPGRRLQGPVQKPVRVSTPPGTSLQGHYSTRGRLSSRVTSHDLTFAASHLESQGLFLAAGRARSGRRTGPASAVDHKEKLKIAQENEHPKPAFMSRGNKNRDGEFGNYSI
jgi:hypothetical protein